jgi:hypothetical protein
MVCTSECYICAVISSTLAPANVVVAVMLRQYNGIYLCRKYLIPPASLQSTLGHKMLA